MKESQTECGHSEDLNPFLVGTLDSERRRAFLEHLASCHICPATLDALREDENLASAPLTAEERRQMQRIVESGSRVFRDHLERDRERRQNQQVLAVPTFAGWQSQRARRALWFASLFALLAGLVLWSCSRS